MNRYAAGDDGGVVFLSGEVDVSSKGGDERRPKFSKKFEARIRCQASPPAEQTILAHQCDDSLH